ncbi:MAG TPA: endo-1,4-beta-xylanase [Fimbriimonas sp.]
MASLRELSEKRGVRFGCAVSVEALDDPEYVEAVGRECGISVAENASKFGPLCPSQGSHDYSAFDRIVAFAEERGMALRGHALVWHTQTPKWLGEDLPVREILADHIEETVGRYRGRIESWDVVNEAVADDAGMRDTIFLRSLGPDYLEWAFRIAHEADPGCQLVYNDYSIDEVCPKSDRVYELLSDLLGKGVPVHGVGLQAHLELSNPPNMDSVRRNVRRFRDLGLQVLVTEMDVRIPEPFSQEKREEQGRIYEEFVRACVEEGVTRILTWGLTDRYSWIPGFFQGTGEALPLDSKMRTKPAFEGLTRALGESTG